MGPQETAAIFLDRDGVIIANRSSYVRTWQDVEFLQGALDALAKMSALPYKLVIITNQSVVGRGMISLAAADNINKRLVNEIEKVGGRIDAVYMCPHAPQDNCACRKPRTGMLHMAAEAQGLDLSRSLLVGDAITDLQAGRSAGLSQLFLVLTGRGSDQQQLPSAEAVRPFVTLNSLAALPGVIGK